VAQDRVQCQGLVNRVMKPRVPQKASWTFASGSDSPLKIVRQPALQSI
jgi:hypothetical protein